MISGVEHIKWEKRWAPKVRTGCQTCKRRRVKCDEGQPNCQRCLRADITCEGYQKNPQGKVFFSIGELEKLKTLPSGSLVGRVGNFLSDQDAQQEKKHQPDDLDLAVTVKKKNKKVERVRRAKRSFSKNSGQSEEQIRITEGTGRSWQQMSDVQKTTELEKQIVLVQPRSQFMDSIDPFRTSALTEMRYAPQLLTFWHIWTKGAPHAHEALQICIYHEAALSSLLAANALFMKLLGLDMEGDKKYRLLTYRSLRDVREQSVANPDFFLDDVGLTALSWLMIASWFGGEIEATRTHLKGFRAVLSTGKRPLEDFPIYLQQIIVYIDFMSAMGSLANPIIGIIPETLSTDISYPMSVIDDDVVIRKHITSFLIQFNAIGRSVGSNFAPLLAAAQSLIHLTLVHMAIVFGKLPVSYFSPASYMNFRAVLNILSFAFESTETEEGRNTARIGIMLIIWSYSLVAPFGVLNNGGFFVYPEDVFQRFPKHKTPQIHNACRSLNHLFKRLRTGTTTLSPRITPSMACEEIGRLGRMICGGDLSDAAVIMRRYMDLALDFFNAEHVMRKEAHNFDISRRIRFLGPLVASETRVPQAGWQQAMENS